MKIKYLLVLKYVLPHPDFIYYKMKLLYIKELKVKL